MANTLNRALERPAHARRRSASSVVAPTLSPTRLALPEPLCPVKLQKSLLRARIPESTRVAASTIPTESVSGSALSSATVASTISRVDPTIPPPDLPAAESWRLPPITEAKRVVLVRHGESTWNATGRIQGSSNFSELTEKGEAQAETSRQMLQGDHFDICYHSPLQRSAKTAQIIWARRSAPMQPIDDLREIDLYSFQGLLKDEGKQRYGEQYRMWQVDAASFEIDGHYPVRELWARARHCWEVMLAGPGSSVLVVAHNAVNQALVATAIGLGPEYFRVLLQSNCGVSVLDFTPSVGSTRGEDASTVPPAGDGGPLVSLNRLNQTPSPPVGAKQSAGRKAKCRAILVCHGMTDSIARKHFPASPDEPLNMLGVVQSRKTAELLLDVRVDSIFTSPLPAALSTAQAIYEVQQAADCLGADCVPRYIDLVPLPQLADFHFGVLQGTERPSGADSSLWAPLLDAARSSGSGSRPEGLPEVFSRADAAWGVVREQLAKSEAELAQAEAGVSAAAAPEDGLGPILPSGTVVVVAHEIVLKALIGCCLGLDPEGGLTFAIDEGSVCVVDFPDGARGRAVVRCLNYSAHLGRWAVPVTLPTFGDENF